jgi:hypothetical protein
MANGIRDVGMVSSIDRLSCLPAGQQSPCQAHCFETPAVIWLVRRRVVRFADGLSLLGDTVRQPTISSQDTSSRVPILRAGGSRHTRHCLAHDRNAARAFALMSSCVIVVTAHDLVMQGIHHVLTSNGAEPAEPAVREDIIELRTALMQRIDQMKIELERLIKAYGR